MVVGIKSDDAIIQLSLNRIFFILPDSVASDLVLQ